MRDASGDIQSVLVLGGGSDIARSIVDALVQGRTTRVILAGRSPDALTPTANEITATNPGVSVDRIAFDADDTAGHGELMDQVFAAHGDIDLVILAFAQLGQPFSLDQDPAAAAAVAHTNYVGGVSSAVAAAAQLRTQGHGTLCVLSSVAGERVRAENAVYGSTKAGLDGFAQGLHDALDGTGARVMIVRPGFVHSKMTEGMDAAPFATTPDKVAEDVLKGLRQQRRVVWSPPILRWVFSALRHVPHPVWRRVTQS